MMNEKLTTQLKEAAPIKFKTTLEDYKLEKEADRLLQRVSAKVSVASAV